MAWNLAQLMTLHTKKNQKLYNFFSMQTRINQHDLQQGWFITTVQSEMITHKQLKVLSN